MPRHSHLLYCMCRCEEAVAALGVTPGYGEVQVEGVFLLREQAGGRPGRRSRRLPGQCVFAFAHTTLMSSPLGALNGLAGAKPARANHSGGFGALGRSWQRRSLKLCVCSTLAVLSASVDSVAAEMKSGRTRVVLESEWRVGASLAVKASCHWKLLFEEKLTHTHACTCTHVHGHRIASSRGLTSTTRPSLSFVDGAKFSLNAGLDFSEEVAAGLVPSHLSVPVKSLCKSLQVSALHCRSPVLQIPTSNSRSKNEVSCCLIKTAETSSLPIVSSFFRLF